MDASWRDLLVLLRGTTCTNVTCDAIAELAEQNIEVLPDLFHDIVFDLLVSSVTHVRSNGCMLLRKLCAVFVSLLKPLLSLSCTDGVLFTIRDIDIARIVACTGGQLLGTSSTADITTTVYTSGWLKTQVSELRTRIGLESSSVEVADASRYDNVEDFLQHTDMIEEQDYSAMVDREASVEPSGDFPCQLNLLSVEQTSETWFARLLRVMIVGLLSPKWEVRHGYALGLTSILDGLYPDMIQGSAHLVVGVPQLKYEDALPAFLCDDMLCCGICVLLLDRFMDFGGGEGSSVAPVKEAAGALVACALRCMGTTDHKDKTWELIAEMSSSPTLHWTVSLGGLIALKYFVRSNADWVLAGRWDLFVSLILRGVRSAAAGQEEVACAACEVLKALSGAYVLRCSLNCEETMKALECLISMPACVDEMAVAGSANGLWEAPSCLLNLFSAVRSLSHITSVLLNTIPLERCCVSDTTALRGVDMIVKLITALGKLVGMLFAYADDVRQRCMQMCLETLQSFERVLQDPHMQRCLATNSSVLTRELHTAHFALLGAILFSSCVSSQYPCTDLQLEDVSCGHTTVDARSQQQAAARAATASAASDVDASDASLLRTVRDEAHTPDIATQSAAHHDHQFRWRAVADSWMKIAERVCLPLPEKAAAPTVEQFVVQVLTCSADITHLCTIAVSLDTAGRNRAIAVFSSRLLAYSTREKQRSAPLPGFDSSSSTPAAGAAISLWELSDDTQRTNLTTLLAALAVGCGSDCVGRILRHVSDLTAAARAAVEVPVLVHPLAISSESSVVPKKRKFVVVSDVREAAPQQKLRKADASDACVAPRAQFHESTQPATTVASRQPTLLVLLSFFVLQIQQYAPTWANSAAPVRQELLHMLSAGAGAGLEKHHGGIMSALLAMDVSSALSAACADGFAAYTDCERQRLAAVTAGIILQFHPGSSQFNEVLSSLVTTVRSGDLSCWFVNTTIYALVKMCDGQVHHVVAALLQQCAKGADAHGLWCISSALSACSVAEGKEVTTKFDLLSCVFSTIAQSHSTSGDVVGAAVAVLCMLTGTGSEAAIDDGQAAAVREIGTQLHQLLTREAVLPIPGACSRTQVAEVFHQLVRQRLGALVHCYEAWFTTALCGIGDSDPSVRRSCVQSFRLLVPLASVAKRASAWRRSTASTSTSLPSSDLLDHIFTKQSALKIQNSDRPQDVQIMAALAAKTNLWVESSSSLHAAQLRAYQWEGVSWLSQLRRFGLNGILADEMGLGKSLQALTAMAVQRIESDFRTAPSLIVCPATLVLHWEEEISHYFPEDLLCSVKFSSTMSTELHACDVVVASYEMVRRDVIKGARSTLLGRMWETVIADEAHLIKNPAAGTTKALCSLHSKHRIALSGTPLQNQVEELWSLMNFILPDYIGDYATFRKETVLPIQRSFTARRELKRSGGLLRASFEESGTPAGAAKKKRDSSLAKFHQAIEVSAVGLGLLRTLHKQVLPFILRRTKEMVAKDLPSKTIVDVLCPLSTQQSQLYDAHLRSLNLTDAQMEQELKLVDANDQSAASALPDELIDAESLKQTTAASVGTQSAPRFGGWGAASVLGAMIPTFEEPPPAKPRRNALESLNYLKLLGVHPALVVAPGSYQTRLLMSHTSSGKLLRLANLLLESGVMTREDFSAKLSISELDVGPDGFAGNETEVAEDVGHDRTGCSEDGELEEVCVSEQPEDQYVKEKKSTSGKGKHKDVNAKSKKEAADRIATNAVADHVCSAADEELLPPMHRCLIFAQHRATLDLVEEHVLQRYFPDVGYERLDGSIDAAKRAAIARKFNSQARRSEPVALTSTEEDEATRAAHVQLLKGRLPAAALKPTPNTGASAGLLQEPDQDIRVLLLTTRACGLGLNLTAADTVIFLEHDWNPFADLQAMDRVHRLGQTHPVTVYRLLAESTVEARIMRLQGLKRNIADQVINEANAGEAGGTAADVDNNTSNESSTGSGGESNSSRQFGAVLMQSLRQV